MAGRHRRHTDTPNVPTFGEAGTPDQVKHFDTNVSRHSVVAADKRLFGEYPYDMEPGSKPTIDRSTGERREQ